MIKPSRKVASHETNNVLQREFMQMPEYSFHMNDHAQEFQPCPILRWHSETCYSCLTAGETASALKIA